MKPRATKAVTAATIQSTICQPSQTIMSLEMNRSFFFGSFNQN
jgi:hypothetical protein